MEKEEKKKEKSQWRIKIKNGLKWLKKKQEDSRWRRKLRKQKEKENFHPLLFSRESHEKKKKVKVEGKNRSIKARQDSERAYKTTKKKIANRI